MLYRTVHVTVVHNGTCFTHTAPVQTLALSYETLSHAHWKLLGDTCYCKYRPIHALQPYSDDNEADDEEVEKNTWDKVAHESASPFVYFVF